MNFSIEKNSTVSIYQQLINQVTRKVQNGELPSGKKLPTVRELADQLGIARGTVKHAYEELERKGIITMTRGKGTFIREQARQESSAKVRAMAAIERLLDEMESLSFSPQEIQMFFNLKMRERMERDDNVCIIFIDCNPETLANIINQISVLPNIAGWKCSNEIFVSIFYEVLSFLSAQCCFWIFYYVFLKFHHMAMFFLDLSNF